MYQKNTEPDKRIDESIHHAPPPPDHCQPAEMGLTRRRIIREYAEQGAPNSVAPGVPHSGTSIAPLLLPSLYRQLRTF